MAGVMMDSASHTPVSRELNTTSIEGVFVCGNSYQVYDVVDSVSRDSEQAGRQAAAYLKKI
jgi:DNA-binding LacI/PurR family transcriptional regulator